MTEVYLLDASVLITAKNLYYEFGRVDQYWDWLVSCATRGDVKIPTEIMMEMNQGNDDLSVWVREHRAVLELDEEVDVSLLRRVTDTYALDLNQHELEALGRDPFLIAYVLARKDERVVVTAEGHGNQKRQNRKIPDVCRDLDVKCYNQWDFGRVLNFRA